MCSYNGSFHSQFTETRRSQVFFQMRYFFPHSDWIQGRGVARKCSTDEGRHSEKWPDEKRRPHSLQVQINLSQKKWQFSQGRVFNPEGNVRLYQRWCESGRCTPPLVKIVRQITEQDVHQQPKQRRIKGYVNFVSDSVDIYKLVKYL